MILTRFNKWDSNTIISWTKDADCGTEVAARPTNVGVNDPPIGPKAAYELILEHRRKRVNFVQILKELEYAPGGKALLNIPLVPMISLQVVHPALASDIAKLQANFVHGYRAEAAVFYVSTCNVEGLSANVKDEDRLGWDEHWQAKDEAFERQIQKDPVLKKLSNKYFFVWDGNHRLLAWMDFISRTHPEDPE